ncbi:alanine racemase [Arthrobacter sp. H5]|uniref:alanine racemase n=1 Tax=Arthrobacter sp. H5 TaxID=1267973 RepID=UPI0004B57395|nr:alanine racemase [Arthrobacter sp. H5]
MAPFDGSLVLETLPQLLLNVTAVENNIAIKETWAREHSMVLAPHIKTTMTREIVERQLSGAWGVTVATTGQAADAVEWGAKRILIANEVVFRPHLELLRDMTLSAEIYCLADSAAGIELMADVFKDSARPLHVLIDAGMAGGRTGIRRIEEAEPLARMIESAPGLNLAGVSAYEGIAPNLRTAENLALVDAHCSFARDVFESLHSMLGARPVFSIGGSAFQDRAAMFLPGTPSVNVLRSGCYVVHDHGTYAGVSPIPGLTAAAVVRAVVISVPEPGRAVIGAGKRELAYDAGLPVIVARHRSGAVQAGPPGEVERLFDHHAVVDNAEGFEVGDTVDFGISHPCSVFDRWRDVVAVIGDSTEIWHPAF